MKKIAIIGTGYVGLVTGSCLAELGNQVICLDIDREKVASLRANNLPFFEPGLEELVKRGVEAKRLSFTDSYTEAIPGCDVCFLCLPTPSTGDESCDLSYVFHAVKHVADAMDNELIIVTKSTVPVGTAKQIKQTIEDSLAVRGVKISFEVVSNPEFLRQGTAISDSMQPDRILLGVSSKKAGSFMKELYAPFCVDHDTIIVMDIASCELSKYAANAMLACRISLMNTLSGLCEKLGGNIDAVRLAIGSDERIGDKYLRPGLGFGGSCLPKDVKALKKMADEANVSAPMLKSIIETNEYQREAFFHKIHQYFGSLSQATLAIWGLSFKPNTDDLREAPSLYLIEKFLEHGASLRLYDPVAMPKAKLFFNHDERILFCNDEYEAAENADALILITEWKQFQLADFEKIGVSLNQKVFFDGRNQTNESELIKLGFEYFGIGKHPTYHMALA